MTDFDADEPVPPLGPKSKGLFTADRVIGWSGAALALTAAFFPWYVFFNEDKFGLEYIRQIASRDLPEWAGRPVVNASPSGIGDRDKNAALPRPEDLIITGTVPNESDEEKQEEASIPAQPLPAAPRAFRLLHVVKAQAMIEDRTGIYVVRIGDTLPDLSKIASLEQRDGKWVVVTDKGTVYGSDGKQP
jgi:hypothetical protein